MRSQRILLVNRRGYPGSTPYNVDELRTFAEGPDNARYSQLIDDGTNCALLLDGLIQSLSLPQEGGVAVVGWSLGNKFTLAMIASIETLPEDVQVRLGMFVKRTIIWGMSCTCI